MSEEILNDYDDYVQKTSSYLLSEIINDNPKNTSICILALLNEKNELLCVSRKNNHNLFGFICGKKELGEHPKDTIIRETVEEIGLPLDFDLAKQIFHINSNSREIFLYIAKINDIGSATNLFKTNENHVIKWIHIDDFLKTSFNKICDSFIIHLLKNYYLTPKKC